jgi:TonB family protein
MMPILLLFQAHQAFAYHDGEPTLKPSAKEVNTQKLLQDDYVDSLRTGKFEKAATDLAQQIPFWEKFFPDQKDKLGHLYGRYAEMLYVIGQEEKSRDYDKKAQGLGVRSVFDSMPSPLPTPEKLRQSYLSLIQQNLSMEPIREYGNRCTDEVFKCVDAVGRKNLGHFKIELHIEQDGAIANAKIIRPSGSDKFDRQLLDKVRQLRFPKPPKEWKESEPVSIQCDYWEPGAPKGRGIMRTFGP